MSTSTRRLGTVALVGATALGLGAVTASSASADPKGEPLTIQCDESGTLDVIVAGNGDFAPGLVVGSTQVGVPYRFTLTGVFTPTGGDPEPFADDFSRPAPQHRRIDHCTFHQEGSLPEGTFVIDGDIWISYTPRH
jgi:hypothetical protein